MRDPRTGDEDPLRIPDEMRTTYRYSYGGASPFFRALLTDDPVLKATECQSCGTTWCPPRERCSKCHGDVDWIDLPGTGEVYSHAVTYYPSSNWDDEVPFATVYIQLDGADNAMLHWVKGVDPEDIQVGMRVEVVFEEEREGKVSDFHFVAAE